MKFCFAFLIFFIASLTSVDAVGQDRLEHELRVALEPARGHIQVRDTIILPVEHRDAGSMFTLSSELVIHQSVPAIREVDIAEGERGITRYELAADSLSGTLVIEYSGVIDHGIDDEKEQYAKGIRSSKGLLSPLGVYLHAGTDWYPKFDDELIRFKMDVVGPSDWHVISQGNGKSDAEINEGGQRVARWVSGTDLEQIYIVGGPLTVQRDSSGRVEALVYLHEDDQALAQKYLDATNQYVPMYEDLIGEYPYEKFALVENFWETGYGMPSFTLLGPQVIRLPFILHSSYPHEILHNWWGNLVFVEYESGNWCEGLTAYMADHLIQEQRSNGHAYRRDTLQKYRSYVKEGRDFPLNAFRSRHSASTEAVGYGKSLMFFHMLRRELGDEAFREVMQDFYKKNRGRRASFGDIRSSVESVSGVDYAAFFDQWIDLVGAPRLVLRDVRVGDEGLSVSGTIEQVQDGHVYSMTVPIVISTPNGQEEHFVKLSSSQTRFRVMTNAAPHAVALDPSFDLFRVLDPREMPGSIGQIFGEDRITAILPSGEKRDAYRALVEGWRKDAHKIDIVLDNEIDALPTDRASWVLGQENRFAFVFTGEDAQAGAIMLGDERVAFDKNSVVMIRRHPDDVEKAIGFISVDPLEAFAGMGRKLPHYGKYSYLAFKGDEPSNFVKGQWETEDSPMLVQLQPHAGVKPQSRQALAELPPVFSERRLIGHVQWLAHPDREGRGVGTQGLNDSARYIAEQFARAGLVPGGDDGSWFQTFTMDDSPSGEPVEVMNVIGVLPGSNQTWDSQSVVLGAHYDHLGFGWPDAHAEHTGQIHPGADDNASGVSVLIELAHNMGNSGGGSRNLVFVAFGAEESGLHGSKHYVRNPVFPISDVMGMVNLDAVGRLEGGEINVHATGTADEWVHIFRGIGFVTGIKSKSIPQRIGGSDQDSFIDAGVPGVQLFTGAHTDYHRPSDTADKIDARGLVKVAVFTKEALAYLIEREEPMTVRIEGAGESERAATRQSSGGRRVSFGIVPSFEFDGPGVLADDIVPGSPAEEAGIQAGDVITRIGTSEISDLRVFSQYLKSMKPDEVAQVVILRDGVELTVAVTVRVR